jgi:hypothetical protein
MNYSWPYERTLSRGRHAWERKEVPCSKSGAEFNLLLLAVLLVLLAYVHQARLD